jgi:hypothetical protein
MVSVWVNEQTCPMCSAPLTVSGGVSMEKTASREAEESNLYYARLFPPARPLVLEALKRRLERHRAGLRAGRGSRRGSGAGIGTHAGQGSASGRPAARRILPAPQVRPRRRGPRRPARRGRPPAAPGPAGRTGPTSSARTRRPAGRFPTRNWRSGAGQEQLVGDRVVVRPAGLHQIPPPQAASPPSGDTEHGAHREHEGEKTGQEGSAETGEDGPGKNHGGAG